MLEPSMPPASRPGSAPQPDPDAARAAAARAVPLPDPTSPEQVEAWARAYLRHAPLSLCLRELNRLLAMVAVDAALGVPAGPVLDVGCGDGFWWTQRHADGREIYGIDISAGEVALAQKHIKAEVADVSVDVPFAARFGQIIGNCSLEHVREIDGALRALRRVAAPDARLVLFVPAPQWAFQGRLQSLLLKRAPRVAMAVAGALNGFFQHWHLYELPVWRQILAQNGWSVSWSRGLGSERSELMFRLFLPPSFASFVVKKVTGQYPSALLKYLPDAALTPLAKLVRWAVTGPLVAPDSPHAYEYVLVAEPGPLPAAPDGDLG
jgi:SAM-dependent methyltransferase